MSKAKNVNRSEIVNPAEIVNPHNFADAADAASEQTKASNKPAGHASPALNQEVARIQTISLQGLQMQFGSAWQTILSEGRAAGYAAEASKATTEMLKGLIASQFGGRFPIRLSEKGDPMLDSRRLVIAYAMPNSDADSESAAVIWKETMGRLDVLAHRTEFPNDAELARTAKLGLSRLYDTVRQMGTAYDKNAEGAAYPVDEKGKVIKPKAEGKAAGKGSKVDVSAEGDALVGFAAASVSVNPSEGLAFNMGRLADFLQGCIRAGVGPSAIEIAYETAANKERAAAAERDATKQAAILALKAKMQADRDALAALEGSVNVAQ